MNFIDNCRRDWISTFYKLAGVAILLATNILVFAFWLQQLNKTESSYWPSPVIILQTLAQAITLLMLQLIQSKASLLHKERLKSALGALAITTMIWSICFRVKLYFDQKDKLALYTPLFVATAMVTDAFCAGSLCAQACLLFWLGKQWSKCTWCHRVYMCIRSGISFIKQTAKQLTYHWVYCFLREQSRSLDTRQIAVPKLPFSSHPAYLLARFNRLWQQEIQIEGRRPTKFALCRCLSRTFAAQLAACVGLRLLVFAKDVGLPLLLSHIIYSLDYRQPADLAGCIWLLVLYLIASVLAAIVEQNHIDVCDQTTLAISNTLLCAVHQIHSTGSSNRHLLVPIAQLRAIAEQHGTDLFSCGIQSTADLAQSVVQLANSICTPVRLFFGVYVFYRQIGWPIVPGIAITLLYLPIRSLLLHRSASAQRQASGASARRIALISHLIDNIVPIRLLGWCNAVTERIGQIRVADELLPNIRCSMLGSLRAYLWKSCRTGAPLLCLAVYSIFAHGSEDKSSLISAERVYIVQTAMRELIPLLIDLPHAFDGWWAAQQPFRQVSALLSQAPKACLKDKQPFAADSSKPACAISITRMTFTWPAPARSQAGGNSFALSNVTMHVSPGQLVAIVGGVSAGKSSLLAAMLGEMDPQCLCPDSSMRISRRVALVAQSPWILNASIQDNITFGQPFHHAWFHRVIRACELSDDFQVWEKQGRLAASSVGSGGMALSGGQRMRIALARAVYSRPSVVLLDSILSAVDVRVAQRLLDNVLLGPRALLSKATRVVATNHHALINAADAVYSIDQTGRVSKLPLTAVKAAMPTAAKDATVASPPLPDSISDYMADSEAGSSASTLSSMDAAHPIAPAASPKGAMDPVRYMLRLCGASRVAAFFAIAIAQCFAAYQYQHWKSQAVPPVSHGTLSSSAVGHLAACASWWLADNVLELAIDWWSTVIWKRALFARSHHQLLSSIALNMPLRQFAVSSTGKILSLFTNAQSDLDTRLPLQLSNLITFAIKIIVETWVILNFHPILVLSVAFVVVCMWQIVRLCQLPLKHLLERKSRMYPLIHKLYQESLSGATTIRAFETGGDFMQQQLVSQLDEYSRLRVACDSIETWIDLSMTVLREVTLFVALAVALLGPRLMPQYVSLQADSAQIIMVHSAITLLLARLQHSIRHSHLLQSVVESTNEYVRTVQSNQHAQCPLDDSRLWLKHWKISGAITFKNVCASYSTALSSGICPLALQNMSFAIRPGQHVGIVGRTGSGKTSIAMALMGLLQPHSGRICIDNIDLSQIPKSVLPEYLTVVPQSAYIMPGTIRDNLDPYGRHSSTELKKALSIVNLQTSLDTVIDNWSWGQKQLLGIARALLRKESSSILILDEATSSLDLKQSQLVNQAIRSYYRSRTVITIAHRLESVMDCQLILVVHQGAICELGSPQQLLACKSSVFAQMSRQ